MQEIRRPALLDGSFHHHLLRDRARLDAYAEAIRRVVRPGDVVADIGSGSGVLAFLAWRAGARRVHAVEMNTSSYQHLLRFARLNDALGEGVRPTLADGTQWRPPERVDVVLCELMETGLLHESIAAVVRNVRSWESRPRAFVPRRARLLAEGVALDDRFHGYRAPLPGFRADAAGEHALTDAATYAEFELLDEAPPETIDAAFALAAREDGDVGALQLRTTTLLVEGVEAGPSPAYCTPLVLPLEEPIRVRAGDRLEARLAYDLDYTSEPVRFEVRRA